MPYFWPGSGRSPDPGASSPHRQGSRWSPLLVEQLVAQARRGTWMTCCWRYRNGTATLPLCGDCLCLERIPLDEAGLAAWAALTLFPAAVPQRPTAAAVGEAASRRTCGSAHWPTLMPQGRSALARYGCEYALATGRSPRRNGEPGWSIAAA